MINRDRTIRAGYVLDWPEGSLFVPAEMVELARGMGLAPGGVWAESKTLDTVSRASGDGQP